LISLFEKPINGTYVKASREAILEAGILFPYQYYDFIKRLPVELIALGLKWMDL
jgi:hypothetical protein